MRLSLLHPLGTMSHRVSEADLKGNKNISTPERNNMTISKFKPLWQPESLQHSFVNVMYSQSGLEVCPFFEMKPFQPETVQSNLQNITSIILESVEEILPMKVLKRRKFLLHEISQFHSPVFLIQTATDPQFPNKMACFPPPTLSYKFRRNFV